MVTGTRLAGPAIAPWSLALLALVACGRNGLDWATPGMAGSTAGTSAAAGTVGAAGTSAAGTAGRPPLPDASVPDAAKKALGVDCAGASECASGFCVDGVCCKSECQGSCVTCAGIGQRGACVRAPAGAPCNRGAPSGGCLNEIQVIRDECNALGDCHGVTVASCAPHKCVHKTDACDTSCEEDGDCAAPARCRAGTCLSPPAVHCTAPDQCESGFCVQGICCNAACPGPCLTCALPGAVGRCLTVPRGAPDPRGICKDSSPAACGQNGRCDGTGGCAIYAAGTTCGPTVCANGKPTPPPVCDGHLMCVSAPDQTCGPGG